MIFCSSYFQNNREHLRRLGHQKYGTQVLFLAQAWYDQGTNKLNRKTVQTTFVPFYINFMKPKRRSNTEILTESD